MGLLELVLTLAVVGFVVWLITTYIPMPQPIKVAIIVLVVVVMIFVIMRAFGIGDIPLRRP